MTHNVPVQSLIDHIKTAIDVDQWAKEMVENLLKEQEHKDRLYHALEEDWKRLKELLNEQPEIVRCRDCKRRGTYDCPVYVGGDGMYSEPDDWFCADVERKD